MRIYCVLREAVKAKTFIRFSSEKSREMVRTILEPHPTVGLRTQDVYNKIHQQFPNEEEKESFLPPETHLSNTIRPPKPNHPVRSMNHLKSTVLPEMVASGQIHPVYVKKGTPQEDGTRLDRVNYKRHGGECWLPTDIKWAQEWRWRLTPNYEPKEMPDPSIATVLEAQTSPRIAGQHGMSRKAKARVKEARVTSQMKVYGRKLV